jgi:hypothetical protein
MSEPAHAKLGPSGVFVGQALTYDPVSGVLRWRHRPLAHFKDERACRAWNTTYAGQVAGTVDTSNGYRYVYLQGRRWGAHRLAWVLLHGALPAGQIDHMNGHRLDNRAKNLRDVTPLENGRNTKRKSNNTSGCTGVRWVPERGKWHARIKVSGRNLHLGYFSGFSEAVSARKRAERLHAFHPGHDKVLEM